MLSGRHHVLVVFILYEDIQEKKGVKIWPGTELVLDSHELEKFVVTVFVEELFKI
jgi:hypothetical protein